MILQPDSKEFRAMLQGYAGCLLWTMPGADGDETPGDRFTWERFTHCARMVAAADCLEFLAHVDRAGLASVLRDTCSMPHVFGDDGRYTWARLGHDVALSRNGHGAGFFDRSELTSVPLPKEGPGWVYLPECMPRDRFSASRESSRGMPENLGDALQWIAAAMGERDAYASGGWVHLS